MKKTLRLFSLLLLFISNNLAAHSVARQWNEAQLNAIRIDAARPPVQARNLFHVAIAMYDAWAAYDNVASTYILGKTLGGIHYPFTGIPAPADIAAARNEAISYAAYRVMVNRYSISPNWATTQVALNNLMSTLGYSIAITGTNYSGGSPAQLGNYIAAQIIAMGNSDGANQANNYAGTGYTPNNAPLVLTNSGNPTMTDVTRWQQLTYVTCIDQNGNPCGTNTPGFVCPLWGKVLPFSMPTSTATHYTRDGVDYPVYDDPGAPPILSLTDVNDPSSIYCKWGHSMVAAWSSHLDPNNPTVWDISPNGKGNVSTYPTTLAGQQAFYDFNNGLTQMGTGYTTNPATGLPYTPQLVKRGDYTRVASQYWADGPTSETPPGHWYTFLNSANDHPSLLKKMGGVGPICPDLEWDVKCYFTLGGAMHDAAITCWGAKGWYDSPRPISLLRKMAVLGQCSDSTLPMYHKGGLALIPGFIEQVNLSDPFSLRGSGNVNVGKIKIKAWKGFSSILYSGGQPINAAGVDWILAEKWMPYQRETFVSPPFAGYYSGHSTYSRAGANALTNLTGSPYFPGGLAEYVIPANSNFIGFEKSPTTEVRLQWATYRDASDEASLSRIWGGIHPPFDDIPGRMAGEIIGNEAFSKAKTYFDGQVMTVSIASNLANPICQGSNLIFTATATNAPSGAIFTWKKNGVVVSTGSNTSYASTTLLNNDVILCELSGNGHKVASDPYIVVVNGCSPTGLSVKLFLQGYFIQSGIMTNTLANQGVGSSATLSDSITLELHASTEPYALIESKKAALMTNGTASCIFSSPTGSYYIAVKHRNTIETWSAAPVAIGTANTYDFSLAANKAYGSNMLEVESGTWALFSGDLNDDLNIDLVDFSLLEGDVNLFLVGYQASDINGDGNVDLLDASTVEANINEFIFTQRP